MLLQHRSAASAQQQVVLHALRLACHALRDDTHKSQARITSSDRRFSLKWRQSYGQACPGSTVALSVMPVLSLANP